MSTFIPEPGVCFYMKLKPYKRDVEVDNGFGGTSVKTIVQQDGSYMEDIFKCIARDDTHLVVKPLNGCFRDKAQLRRIEKYEFAPVGPGMLDALEINPDE